MKGAGEGRCVSHSLNLSSRGRGQRRQSDSLEEQQSEGEDPESPIGECRRRDLTPMLMHCSARDQVLRLQMLPLLLLLMLWSSLLLPPLVSLVH